MFDTEAVSELRSVLYLTHSLCLRHGRLIIPATECIQVSLLIEMLYSIDNCFTFVYLIQCEVPGYVFTVNRFLMSSFKCVS